MKIPKRLALFALLSTFLFGCATQNTPRQPNEQEKAIKELVGYEHTISESLKVFQTEPERSCSSSTLVNAKAALQNMNLLSHLWYLKWSNAKSTPDQYLNERVLNVITPATIEMNFLVADTLLSNNCLESADEIYRAIISRFTGGRYASIRERAKIGVDDVRSQQSKR